METLNTLTAKKEFIKNNLDKLSDETRPSASQINAFKAGDTNHVDALVEEINSFVAPANDVIADETVEKVDTLVYETLTTESGASVEVVWLPFLKYGMRQDKQTRKVRTNYQFGFGSNIVTIQNSLLDPIKKSIEVGAMFPIKVETIQPIVAERTYGYGKQVFSAGIAEFACELLLDARAEKMEELEELSQLSAEAQEMVIKATALSQAEQYLLKKGIKLPSSMK
ncbi:MAG: hypothetical protein RIR01_2338 [Bacteroidota bacterium]|jgi:hypothetical protein